MALRQGTSVSSGGRLGARLGAARRRRGGGAGDGAAARAGLRTTARGVPVCPEPDAMRRFKNTRIVQLVYVLVVCYRRSHVCAVHCVYLHGRYIEVYVVEISLWC